MIFQAERISGKGVKGLGISADSCLFVGSKKYCPDQIGNRAGNTVDVNGSTAYTADHLNQYSTVGASSPVYDLDGNLTDNGTWTYDWDNENRLASATDGTTTIDFVYDYMGRLVKKDDGTDVEVYLYDGFNRIATFDASPFTLQTSYLWGMDLSGSMQGAGGVGGLLKEGSLYPTYDANGNIMQKLDGAGATVMNVDYDSYGNIISGTLVGDYGFSTKPLVDDLDWYYYGFRYYDPVTGRWSSRDPIGEYGGRNRYAFVGNSPTNLVDVLGLWGISPSPGGTVNCPRGDGRGPTRPSQESIDLFVDVTDAVANELEFI